MLDGKRAKIGWPQTAPTPGPSPWGAWFQGEVGGGYLVSNSNLVTHQIRAHLTPSKSLGTGLIGYVFQLDQPESYAPGVTSKSLLLELDAYGEWKVNNNFLVILVAAYATPQEAAEQAFDRTDDFFYGVVYVGYSY